MVNQSQEMGELTTMPAVDGDCRVKSGARVVAVLEYFHSLNRPARAYEIGGALDLAPSSTNDLLKTLVEVGYLDFDEVEKTYFPGLRAALFGQWLANMHPDLQRVEAFARVLGEESGEHVTIFSHRQHQVQIISVIRGPSPPPDIMRNGTSLPVFSTAAGCAVLMLKTHEELYEIARRTFRTKACGKAVMWMDDIVQNCKRRGYATSVRENFIPDNWAIALPLPVKLGSKSIVVGLAGPVARMRNHELELANLTRHKISAHFGQATEF